MNKYTEIFKAFDAWGDLYKARKAKGLDNWSRLEHLAVKLAGKHSKDISFSCSHPKHGNSGDKHNLGSTEGNLHFLLGYGNPGFHLAPYHWQIIYPDLTDDEVMSLSAEQGHPSQPRLWEKTNLDVVFEGDLEEGAPHSYAHIVRTRKEKDSRTIKAKSKYGTYTADPIDGTVQESITGRIYKWDLIKNSYFAADNPKIVEAMDAGNPEPVKKSVIPEPVRTLLKEESWNNQVYPLVKAIFPKPGSVVTLSTGSETVYGLVRPSSIDLVDCSGNPVAFKQYDQLYKSLDLLSGGETHPSILYNFAVKYLKIDGEHLMSIVKSQNNTLDDELPNAVNGQPSAGYETVDPVYNERLSKSVILKDHTFRLVVEN